MIGRTNVGGGGGAIEAFAFVIADYPANSTCTATNGSITLQSMTGTNHPAIFGIPEPLSVPESWTVTATNGTSTKSETVSITQQYQIENVVITFSLLPIEYQEVEYLESTTNGGQYIDIGQWMDQTSTNEYDIVFMMRSNLTHAVCGVVQKSGNDYYGGAGLIYTPPNVQTASVLAFAYSQSVNSFWLNASGIISLNTKYTAKINTASNKYNINGTDMGTTYPQTGEIRRNLYLFAQHYIGENEDIAQNGGNTRIYSFVQKNNQTDEKSMDLVPCYRRADEVAGMYDLVNSTFMTNAGTGTFTLGPNV